MDGTRSGLTLAHTFRIGRDGEQLPFLRSACPSLDLYHLEAAPGNTESRSSCGHLQDFGSGRQSEMKCCSSSIVGGRPQPAAVRLHNGTTDGQPHPAALWLGGEEGRKDLVNIPSW